MYMSEFWAHGTKSDHSSGESGLLVMQCGSYIFQPLEHMVSLKALVSLSPGP